MIIRHPISHFLLYQDGTARQDYLNIHIYIYIHKLDIHIYIYISLDVSIYIYIYISIQSHYIYIYTNIYVYIYIYQVYIYIYTYICTYAPCSRKFQHLMKLLFILEPRSQVKKLMITWRCVAGSIWYIYIYICIQ